MKFLLLTILLLATVTFYSCSVYFDSYVRNMTKETVTIDVFLIETNQWVTLPN